MPELKLEDLPEVIQLMNISAVMSFPSAKEDSARRNWATKMLLWLAYSQYTELLNESKGKERKLSVFIGSWLGDAIFDLGGWSTLANATIGQGQKVSPVDELQKQMNQGIISGWILISALKEGDGISSSAKRFCSDDVYNKFKEKGLKPPIQDYHHIHNKLWPKFRDAAHLWAAFLDNKVIVPEKKHHLLPIDQFNPGGMKHFLKLADAYREAGENHFTLRGPRKPLLDSKTIWKVSM